MPEALLLCFFRWSTSQSESHDSQHVLLLHAETTLLELLHRGKQTDYQSIIHCRGGFVWSLKKNGAGRGMGPSVTSPITVWTAQPLPCDKYLGRLSSDHMEPSTDSRNGSIHLFGFRRDPLVNEVLHDRRQGKQGLASVDKNSASGLRLRTSSAAILHRRRCTLLAPPFQYPTRKVEVSRRPFRRFSRIMCGAVAMPIQISAR